MAAGARAPRPLRHIVLATIALLLALTLSAPAAAHPRWGITKKDAEHEIRSVTWDGERARTVGCRGIWADGAERRDRQWIFRHLWCQARFSDGWFHFKFHMLSASKWDTTNWTCGKIGENTCPRPDPPDVSDEGFSCTTGGYRFNVVTGVATCSGAREILRRYFGGDATEWQCRGSRSSGICELGLDGDRGYFSYRRL